MSGKTGQQNHALETTAADASAGAAPANAETSSCDQLLKASLGEVNALEDNATAGLEQASPDGQDSMSGKTGDTTAADASAGAAPADSRIMRWRQQPPMHQTRGCTCRGREKVI
eukprot:TRINITY_DN4754_c0_g1_i8.p1 TRINITY_DN4754_c0_g1~~TRINITY_DN4754_c0_g1_i8.p1  ORF type:complete len:134 (-),score=41.94 TRINITY_DN4754_c0_g1_i8:277-618(-)